MCSDAFHYVWTKRLCASEMMRLAGPGGAVAVRVRLRLRFPPADYEAEYGACRQYLPDELAVEAAALEGLAAGRVAPGLADLVRRRVVLELPARYC